MKSNENLIINNNADRIISDTLPKVLKGIKIGISVHHDPDTIYAVIDERDTTRYIWKHTTTVKAIDEDIQILEFGTYNFKNGRWELGNLTKKPYSSKEFEKWYFRKDDGSYFNWENCKNGRLIKGIEYIDPSNWSVTNKNLVERHGLWYYIGVTDKGEKIGGYGRYVVLPQLKDSVVRN
ncbi:MAG: hypothetical protein Kow0068_14190 [Marinilabiliales bacterium]